jgi:hypothetical protein
MQAEPKEFDVTWSVTILARTPTEAAIVAKWMQRHGTWSSVFHVGRGTKIVEVDLDEVCTGDEWGAIMDPEHRPFEDE